MTLRVVRDLLGELAFSEADQATLTMQNIDGTITWNQEAEGPPQEIAIGPVALQVIRDTLEKLDRSGKLQIAWLPLYERFTATTLRVEG